MSDKQRLTLLGILSLLVGARCTFPDYDMLRLGSGGAGAPPIGGNDGTAGTGGAAASAGGGGQGGVASGSGQAGSEVAPVGGSHDGGEPPIGGSPGCLGEQWPVEHCSGGCLLRYPDHCYDGDKSGDEADVDCGGSCQGCSYEACERDADCLSGSCATTTANGSACRAPLSVSFTPQGVNRYVGTTDFRLVVRNTEPADGADFALKDLEVRYYIAGSGIVEPLLVQATQSSQLLAVGESRALPLTSWAIERVEPLTDARYDAYLEVSFADSVRLFPGDSVDLLQRLSTGYTGSSNFDQLANYSFKDQADPQWLHVTLHYRGQLIWGLEPRPPHPRACFARAVKLGGAGVTVEGNAWQAAADANLTTAGSVITQSVPTFPATSGEMAKLLGSGTHLTAGQTLEFPVADGVYLVYLLAISSGTDGGPNLFSLQGSRPESSAGFRAQLINNAGAWARLGPYRVNVTTGTLTVAATSGALSFAGIELWYPE
jgi:hypothetical protein